MNILGPMNQFQPDVTPIELFSHFFTDEVWDLIVTGTNRYAAANRSVSTHSHPWTDVTVEEMKAFVGLLIIMGILALRCIGRLPTL